ncbi:MAG: hypothetical protein ABIB79_03400 [archaeon]
MGLDRIKSFISSHKSIFILLAIVFIFGVFNFISNETFVRDVPMGQGLPMEGQTLHGCKRCTGFGFSSSFGCSTNILPNCPMEFIEEYFIGYALLAIIIGFLLDWIIRKIKSKNKQI